MKRTCTLGLFAILSMLFVVACDVGDLSFSHGCTLDSDCPEGYFCDNAGRCVSLGETPNDGDDDGDNPSDGDVKPDGDLPVDGDEPIACGGPCNAASDTTYCSGGDLCVCEAGGWRLFDCGDICAAENAYAIGCGPGEYPFDYCVCGDTPPDGDTPVDGDWPPPDGDNPPPDGDDPWPDGDIPGCAGDCSPLGDSPYCVGNNVCLCEFDGWQVYDCDEMCANQGQMAVGCGPGDLPFDFCICEDPFPDGDMPPQECRGGCDPDTFSTYCTDGENLCSCARLIGQQYNLNCDLYCRLQGFDTSQGCGWDPVEMSETCICNNDTPVDGDEPPPPECQRNRDCRMQGYDYCISLSGVRRCATACELDWCWEGTPCYNVGRPDGCGICYNRENASTCDSPGSYCDGDAFCSDLCGELQWASCYMTCNTLNSSDCDAGSACRMAQTANGDTVGACMPTSGRCPQCGDFPEEDTRGRFCITVSPEYLPIPRLCVELSDGARMQSQPGSCSACSPISAGRDLELQITDCQGAEFGGGSIGILNGYEHYAFVLHDQGGGELVLEVAPLPLNQGLSCENFSYEDAVDAFGKKSGLKRFPLNLTTK